MIALVACAKSAPPPAPAASPLALADTTLVEAPSPVDAGVEMKADEDFEAVPPNAAAGDSPSVTLTLNVASIRRHPVGRRLGSMMRELPPWAELPRDTAGTLDSFRDTDSLTIAGPSLLHLEKDVMFVGYSGADTLVERAILDLSRQGGKGGAYAVGVPGVKATRVNGTHAERVFLRAGTKLVVVAATARATELAARMNNEDVAPKVVPTEAVRLVVREPRRQISTTRVKLPEDLVELRMALVTHDDGSVTVLSEGTVTSAGACVDVARTLNDSLTKSNDGFAKLATAGVLDSASFTCKSGVPKLRVEATPQQVEKIFDFVAMSIGLPLDP